jgi:hypothetical protein
MKHKYIENHWIQEFECGIFLLMFNTHERWIPYHNYTDTDYIFGGEIKDESVERLRERYYTVEEFLPKGVSYLSTVIQNKDQISFYFIPFDLISREKRIKTEEN